jgi:hypothetical protein
MAGQFRRRGGRAKEDSDPPGIVDIDKCDIASGEPPVPALRASPAKFPVPAMTQDRGIYSRFEYRWPRRNLPVEQ